MRMILTALALLLWCVSAEAQVANPGNLGSVCPGAGALCQPIPVQVVAFQGQGDIVCPSGCTYTGTWLIAGGTQAFSAAKIGSTLVTVNCNATTGTPFNIVSLASGQMDLPTLNSDCGTAVVTAGSVTGTALTATTVIGGSLASGQTIYGKGIPLGTTISSGSGTSWVLSASATGATPPYYSLTNLVFVSAIIDPITGGSNTPVQATATLQPELILADTSTGLPCIYGYKYHTYLFTTAVFTQAQPYTIVGAINYYSAANGYDANILSSSPIVEDGLYGASPKLSWNAGGTVVQTGSTTVNQWVAATFSVASGGAVNLLGNSTLSASGNAGTGTIGNGSPIQVGDYDPGCMATWGVVTTNLSSAATAALIANMHTNLNNYSGF